MPEKPSGVNRLKCKKPLGRPELHPGPRWESLQRSPGPLANGEGAGCPLPKNLTPALGLACPRPLIFELPPN